MEIDYTLHKGESRSAYDARIAGARSARDAANPAPVSAPQSASTYNPDEFMSTLQEKLLANTSISSQDTSIETAINSSMAKISEGNAAAKGAIDSALERQKGYVQEGQERTRTSTLEAGRGGAVGIHALREMDVLDRREIADLESRKQELILQGDATAAKEISDLMIKKYEFRNAAQQQVFSNLLGMGNLGLGMGNLDTQRKQEERMARTQSFAEKSAINSIALKYGLAVGEDDTLDSITMKASQYASDEYKLEMDKTRQEIAKMKAETSKALQGEPGSGVDIGTITGIANAALIRPEVLGTIKNPQQLSAVINKMAELRGAGIVDQAIGYVKSGLSKDEARAQVLSDSFITDKASALKAIDAAYDSGKVKEIQKIYSSSPLVQDVSEIGASLGGVQRGIAEYVFGADTVNKWDMFKSGFKILTGK